MQIYRSSLVSIYFSALLKDASKKQLDLEVADVDSNHWLLVWNSHVIFPYIGNVTYFSGGLAQPPTSQ